MNTLDTKAARGLLDACIAAPADDAPRMAWANAVGGERGELVVIQCELARGGLPRETAIARRRREAELLARHGKAWAGLDGLAESWTFRRGFVEEANVDARTFAEKGEALFAAAPLLARVEFEGLHDVALDEIAGRLERALSSPYFARLRGLRFDRVGNTVETDRDTHPHDFQSAGSNVLKRVIETGSLRALRALELPRCALSSQDVARLADSPDAAGLVELDLRYQQVDRYMGLYPADVQKVVDSPNLARLEALDISGALGRAPWLGGQTRAQRAEADLKQSRRDPALIKHTRILGLRRLGLAACRFNDGMFDALAAAPFRLLEWLNVSQSDFFAEDFERFGAAPGLAGLVELVFDGPSKYTFNAKMAAALGAATRFDALRILRLRNCYMDEVAARTLLVSPLARRLEIIDLRWNREPEKSADALRKLFDGLLLLGEK